MDHNPLEFGQSVKGRSVNINAGNITGGTLDNSPMLSFVSAEAVTANMDVFTGSNPAVVNFSSNCDYVDSKVVGVYSVPDATRNKQFTQDNSLSVQIHSNYSGDTYLDHGLTTFPTKTDSNVVTTEDALIFRSGDKGIRVTANTGNHLAVSSLQRQVNHFEKCANLAGKQLELMLGYGFLIYLYLQTEPFSQLLPYLHKARLLLFLPLNGLWSLVSGTW